MQQVTLHFTSKQLIDGQTDVSRSTYAAQAVYKQDSWYFTYKEQLEDQLEVSCVLKVNKQEIHLLRQGAVSMKQSFQKGKSSSSRYNTPYASYTMEVHTHLMQVQEANDRPSEISIGYQLWLNEQYTGEIHLNYVLDWADR